MRENGRFATVVETDAYDGRFQNGWRTCLCDVTHFFTGDCLCVFVAWWLLCCAMLCYATCRYIAVSFFQKNLVVACLMLHFDEKYLRISEEGKKEKG